MVESKEQERRCDTERVCPLDSSRSYIHGSDYKPCHEVCEIVRRCWARLYTRSKVQTDGGREKLVKEKESHLEILLYTRDPSLYTSTDTHTHTQTPRPKRYPVVCPYCSWETLTQDEGKYRVCCENCLSEFYFVESGE